MGKGVSWRGRQAVDLCWEIDVDRLDTKPTAVSLGVPLLGS